ncbi:class I SAM-dependent methyltransferase [Streptomonospora alba]|uniref:class I SAM-dependent methyltransferase n=1 Tax=Streptomonospora alba TaxID=183763 RepID=UPI0030828857
MADRRPGRHRPSLPCRRPAVAEWAHAHPIAGGCAAARKPAPAGPRDRGVVRHRPRRYDRARPRYPEAVVEAIAGAAPGTEVVDVDCGTGIVARRFQAAGCRVLGVEADERMAAWARRHGVRVEVARFESWAPGDRSFDRGLRADLALGGPRRGREQGRRGPAAGRQAGGVLERPPAADRATRPRLRRHRHPDQRYQSSDIIDS